MPSEETASTFGAVDFSHGGQGAEVGTGVFGELRGGCLEEDLDAIEGSDCCFGLFANSFSNYMDKREG